VKHHSGAPALRYALGLTHKHKARLERPFRDKQSSLLRTFVIIDEKLIIMGLGVYSTNDFTFITLFMMY
jgi:hypothetical protein